MYNQVNQPQQMRRVKSPFQIVFIAMVVGIALLFIGGTANAIHRHAYLGSAIETYENSNKNRVKEIESYQDSSFKEKDEYIERAETQIQYMKALIHEAGVSQIFNIIGFVILFALSLATSTIVFLKKTKLFKGAFGMVAVCTVNALFGFFVAFNNSFYYSLESMRNSYIYQYEKSTAPIPGLLNQLYATLVVIGLLSMAYGLYYANKHADVIFEEDQLLKQQRANQRAQQMQQVQQAQPLNQQSVQQAQPFNQQPVQQAQPLNQQPVQQAQSLNQQPVQQAQPFNQQPVQQAQSLNQQQTQQSEQNTTQQSNPFMSSQSE